MNQTQIEVYKVLSGINEQMLEVTVREIVVNQNRISVTFNENNIPLQSNDIIHIICGFNEQVIGFEFLMRVLFVGADYILLSDLK